MRRILRLVALIPVLVVLLPVLAAPAVAEPDEEAMRAKLLAGGTLTGKLTGIETDKDVKHFTVQVMWVVKTPNKDGQKKLQEVTRRYYDAVRRKDANAAKQIYEEGVAAQMAAWNVQETPLEFELTAGKDLVVRKKDLPLKEPGADGKVKPYTAKEQAEFKGPDTKLPGWNATLKDLELEQYVTIYIDKTKFKLPTPSKTTSKDDPKKDTKTDPKDTKKDDTTKKDAEKKDADKKDAEKKDAKGDGEPVVYPITLMLILPPPEQAPAPGQ